MTPLTVAGGTQSAQNSITRIRYTHDAMIDFIIANPGVSQNAIAAYFGYRAPSISRIFNSDAFQARLAERKQELVDPSITEGFEANMKALAAQSLDIVAEKLAATQSAEMALKVLDLTTKALGYGARQAQGPQIQQNFVVALPQKAATSAAWAATHGPAPPGGQAEPTPGSLPSSTPPGALENLSPDLLALVERVS